MAQSVDDNAPSTNGYSTDGSSEFSRVSTPDLLSELGLVSTPYCPLDSCRSISIEEFERRLEEDSSYRSSSGSNSPDPETDYSDENQSSTANSNSTPQSPNALLRAPVKEETLPPTTSSQPTYQSSNALLLTPAKKETMYPTANSNHTPQSPNALLRSPVKEETLSPTTSLQPTSPYPDAILLAMAIAQLKQPPIATSLSLESPVAPPMASVEDQQKALAKRKEEIWKKAELNNLYNREDNSMFHVNHIMKKKQQDSGVFYNTAWQSEFVAPKRFANTRKDFMQKYRTIIKNGQEFTDVKWNNTDAEDTSFLYMNEEPFEAGTIKDRSKQDSHSDKSEKNRDEALVQSSSKSIYIQSNITQLSFHKERKHQKKEKTTATFDAVKGQLTGNGSAKFQPSTTNPLGIKTQQKTKQHQSAIQMENETHEKGKIGKQILVFEQPMVQQNFELNLKKKTNESKNAFPKTQSNVKWSTEGSWEQSCSKSLKKRYQPNIKAEILDESDYLQSYVSGFNNQKLFEDRSANAFFTNAKTQPADSLMMAESFLSPGTIESALAAVADIAFDYRMTNKKKELHHGVPDSSSQKEEDRRERVKKQKKFPDEKKPQSNDNPQKNKDNKKPIKRSIKEEILDETDYAQSSADLRFKKQKLLEDGSAKVLQPLANAKLHTFYKGPVKTNIKVEVLDEFDYAQPSNIPDSNNKKRKLNAGNSIQTRPNDAECSARPGSDAATKKGKLANGKVVNLKNQLSVNSQRNLNQIAKECENAHLQIKKKELELAMKELKKRKSALDTELSSLPGHLKTLIGHVKREKTSHGMSPALVQNAINALKIVWNDRKTELKKKKRQIRKKMEDLSEESD